MNAALRNRMLACDLLVAGDPDEVADEVLALARDLVRVTDERIRTWTS
ncbi:hypothetical protein [Lentzea albida]|uniref:Uncharacterized protein n=1 Tax=Lentzea albida TaxID=65499 RepID=A0A1H9XH11_9PSEU|nr:hypothetical protein [Lentzea albida]SES45425.1 hypothetical protein SAMN04488000_13628 [Lentzea albida]